jgi:hypothetical protein
MECPLCPNENRVHPEAPVFDGEAPMSTLMCGHQVHTHCLLNELATNHVRAECGECNERVIEERVITFYDNYDRPRNGQTIAQLWANSEEFRNDIKELKKKQLKYNKIKREFNSEANIIKARFLENIRTSLEVIRGQRQAGINEYKRIPCKRTHTSLGNACMRKLNQIRGAYGYGFWDLRRQLADIPGAPKFSDTRYYHRWRLTARYFFRIKL